MDGVSASSGEALTSPQHKALFTSLLGALSYTYLTRIDLWSVHCCITAGCPVPDFPVKRLNVATR
eukprot:8580019-Lingulodinium_polyedra.AAC.1